MAKEAMAKDQIIKVKHPAFGYVEFHGMSLRQKDVLKNYKLLTCTKAEARRNVLKQIREHERTK